MKQTKQVELPEKVNNEIVLAFMTPLQEKLSDILQPLLEIAEGKRSIDEWNDHVENLLNTAEQAQQEAVERLMATVKNYRDAKEIVEDGKRYIVVNGEKKPFGHPYPDKRIGMLFRELEALQKEQEQS